MKLVDKNGNVILEREKVKTRRAKSLNQINKLSVKKTLRSALVKKEEFLETVLNNSRNDNL